MPLLQGPEQPQFVVIWDDVSFHLAVLFGTGSPTIIDFLHSIATINLIFESNGVLFRMAMESL